eukprot:XP_014769667.1 PREDICTED: endoplasmic reticulum-Golgi intermediate compartment protein 3-like [Octopus bimaculoides]
MEPSNIITRLRQFDAYPKTLEDFRVKTFGGAIVTLISSMLMFVLFISELNYYLTKEVHPELIGGKKINVTENPEKALLDPNRCESCYGAETTSDRKVAGNFHFAPGKSFNQHHVHVHDLQSLGGQKFNMSHKVKTLSFGKPYPGIMNPLDGVHVMADKEQMMFQYFVKIVPTMYVKIDGSIVHSNQFSVTRHSKVVSSGFGDSGLPGMFIMYELSPMMVSYTEKQRSFMHFLTGVCAIIGGIFTVAGLIDSMIYHSSRAIQKKIELGKTS